MSATPIPSGIPASRFASLPNNTETKNNAEMDMYDFMIVGGGTSGRGIINTWGSLGNPSWSWDSLLLYCQKSFTLTLPPPESIEDLSLSYIDTDLQRTFSGPLQASFAEEKDGLPKFWIDRWKQMGWGLSSDPFSGEAVGGYINAMNIDAATRKRNHALSAYYTPMATRENLVVVTSALVTKILFSDSRHEKGDVVATGISYTNDSQSYTVSARKEVILAAGVLPIPKLLELSGIGSAALLSDLGVPVVVDNGDVGENL
ncbi:putative glucose-methanol-choline oxidoreductase protein [Botrytis fragariae]|uniref:Putative glucose-methanol-choline oxidoreductase protein n=1 Tax=Botrytis fragariae TaxID=1964551 RepID=A0A8H6EJ51_9HELO|nr:putative glucose-methanol-choline oxidoreductase protein [Botrytis fragariae]KAF5874127.1 putative glucose-methanol-choline oxidoreductase protein [Botrytis fragariae]